MTLIVSALMCGLVAVGMAAGYTWSNRQGLAQLTLIASERLELYAAALQAELARYAYLPSLIAIDPEIARLLEAPADPALRATADRTLARMNARAGSLRLSIVALDGELLASSDAYLDRSDAAAPLLPEPDADEFFAAQPADGNTDYYIVQAVQRADASGARIVVKISLAPLEATWADLGQRTQSERLLVVDENDVVVMSSVPAWKFRTLNAGADTKRRASRYAQASLAPLDMRLDAAGAGGHALVSLPETAAAPAVERLAQELHILPLAARLIALSDLSDVQRNARYAAWGGGACGATLSLLLMYLLHRRRASMALQRAHDDLEQQVAMRTGELQSANDELRREMAQRRQTEDELVQAGKLAVLGQMSAGLSHEINQPLTALRALSRNTIKLLHDGRHRAVAENLQSIDEMTDRMGRIVTQLKSFARRHVPSSESVNLAEAVRDVLLLLEHRLRDERVMTVVNLPPELRVRTDMTRLQQVLVNLVGNALDAMADAAVRELHIAAEHRGDRVVVAVIDSGRGIDAASFERLQEPFFTTKPAGQGLGLGLVISSKIVREFGGELRAVRGEVGMRFDFDLPVAEEAHV